MNKDIFSKIGNTITNKAGRASLVIKKYSPEILVIGGIVGVVAATVMACKATTKLDEQLDDAKEAIEAKKDTMSKVNEETGEREIYVDEKMYRREVALVYLKEGSKLATLYIPSFLIGAASVTMILCGHDILHKRYLATSAAYTALEDRFTKYRERVSKEFGEDVDRRMRYGSTIEEKTVEEVGEDGKKHKHKVKTEVIDPANIGDDAKFFDAASVRWSKDADSNLFVLRSTERVANQMLHSRGHIFLNEVLDMLDIPRTRAGSVKGWILENGDEYVDFGIYDISKEANRRFVNGEENIVLLDFKGLTMIYDKI